LMTTIIVNWWTTEICIRYRRSFASIISNVLLIWVALFVECYGILFKTSVIVSIMIGAFITLLYGRSIWNQYREGKRSRRNAKRYIVHAAKIIVTVCVLIFITVTAENQNFISTNMGADSPSKDCIATWSEEKTMKENMNVIQQFDTNLWRKLSEKEKLEVCQTVCMVESN